MAHAAGLPTAKQIETLNAFVQKKLSEALDEGNTSYSARCQNFSLASDDGVVIIHANSEFWLIDRSYGGDNWMGLRFDAKDNQLTPEHYSGAFTSGDLQELMDFMEPMKVVERNDDSE